MTRHDRIFLIKFKTSSPICLDLVFFHQKRSWFFLKKCLIDIYIGFCVWMQRCGWINPAAHRTTTHTHKKKGSKVSSSSSLFHPLACDSSSLRFVSFFLLAIWSCVFFFFFFAVPFFCFRSPASSCFRYRNLFGGSPQGGKSLSPAKASLSGSCCQVDPSAHRSVCRPTFSNRMALLLISRIGFSSWWLFDSVYLPTWFTIELFSLLSNYHCWSSRRDCWTTGKILLVNWEFVLVAVTQHMSRCWNGFPIAMCIYSRKRQRVSWVDVFEMSLSFRSSSISQ